MDILVSWIKSTSGASNNDSLMWGIVIHTTRILFTQPLIRFWIVNTSAYILIYMQCNGPSPLVRVPYDRILDFNNDEALLNQVR